MIRFFVTTRPAGQGSKRNMGNGVMLESSRFVGPFRQDVRAAALQHCLTPLAGPIRLRLDFVKPRPQSHYKKNGEPSAQWRVHRTTSPDLDKLVRAVDDALGGLAFVDDRQVVQLEARKVWVPIGHPEGVFVEAEELTTAQTPPDTALLEDKPMGALGEDKPLGVA